MKEADPSGQCRGQALSQREKREDVERVDDRLPLNAKLEELICREK